MVTRDTILEPMGKMDWPEKDRYAKELVTILKTSKSEAEIIKRAEQVRESVRGNSIAVECKTKGCKRYGR